MDCSQASYSDGCSPVQGRDVSGPTAINLIVRIGDYSDYFVRLGDVLKMEIINRTEY